MQRDAIFRIASLTKPLVAAATMALVDRSRVTLEDRVAEWLPELKDPVVMRHPHGPVDDVVACERPITIRHLLTLQGGHGLVSDFDLPVIQLLLNDLHQGPPRPQKAPTADEWMRRLAAVPLLHQPGEGWTYNTGSDVLGVLLARVEGSSLINVLTETILGPLGMTETGFSVHRSDIHRLASAYRMGNDGRIELTDAPNGQWASPPRFQSGAGGLVSTVDDYLKFTTMLIAGTVGDETTPISRESIRMMMTPHARAEPGNIFLDDQAWGFGGSVDIDMRQPWNVVGRYGWIGGLGTAAYVIPSSGTAAIWLSQLEMQGPDDFETMSSFLTHAAQV